MPITTKKEGFILLEVIMYIIGMMLILGIVTFMIVQIYGVYRHLTLTPRMDQIGITLVDKLARDIRSGESLNLEESVFGSANGALSISSPVDASENVTKTFSVEDGRVVYKEGNDEGEFLTPSDLTVAGLSFTRLVTPVSEAVRYNIDVVVEDKEGLILRTYPGLSILRYTYE